MRITGIAVALIVAGCGSASREATLNDTPAPAVAEAARSAGCGMESCPMHGGAAMHGRAGAGMHAPAGDGMRAPARGAMHGGAQAQMQQGASCPMHAQHAQPTAPDVSVPEATHDDHDAADADDDAADAADPARGRALFRGRGNCYTCHGPDAKGSALAPDLTDDEWLHADGTAASVRRVIVSGVPAPRQHPAPMPALGGAALTEQDIADVVAFILSLDD